MSIEAIRDKIFTVKNDVWAFGIVLWEIYSLGEDPYSTIEINQDFVHNLEDDYRSSKPEYYPTSVYRMIMQCWLQKPEERPSFVWCFKLMSLINKHYK